MEFFRNTNIDFLGKKWYFLTFSLIFSVAGVLSMAFWHGIPLGVDFRGGTLVYVKYAHTPDVSAIHAELDRAGLKNARVQAYDQVHNSNEVLILSIFRRRASRLSTRAKCKSFRHSRATPPRANRI